MVEVSRERRRLTLLQRRSTYTCTHRTCDRSVGKKWRFERVQTAAAVGSAGELHDVVQRHEKRRASSDREVRAAEHVHCRAACGQRISSAITADAGAHERRSADVERVADACRLGVAGSCRCISPTMYMNRCCFDALFVKVVDSFAKNTAPAVHREHNVALYPSVESVRPVAAQLAADVAASFQVLRLAIVSVGL